MKKKYLITALLLSISIGVAFGLAIISNIFEGLIPNVSLPQAINITVNAPENVAVGAPFYMSFTVTNPNTFTVNARLYINFTLNEPRSTVTTSAMSYFWHQTTFQFTSGGASSDASVADNTWKFNAPTVYPGWYIKIASGTNTYQMQFQVNIQCTSIKYKAWFAA